MLYSVAVSVTSEILNILIMMPNGHRDRIESYRLLEQDLNLKFL